MRVALTGACVASLLVLAVVTSGDAYDFDPVLLLAFAALDIAAVCTSGAIDHPSRSAMTSSLVLLLTTFAYSLSVVIRHPGEFAADGPLLADIAWTALLIAGFAGEVVLLGGLLGAGASAVFLGYRWLRNTAWPRLSARL